MISQRKLLRVKKWKKSDFINKDGSKKDEYQKKKAREEGLNNYESHDYIIVTDSEEFLNEQFEVLDGIHHLTSKSTVYNNNRLDIVRTSKEREIREHAFNEFQVECCKSF